MPKKVSHPKEKILGLLLSNLPPSEQLYLIETIKQYPQWGSLLVKSTMAKAQALHAGDRQKYLDIIRSEQDAVEKFLKNNI